MNADELEVKICCSSFASLKSTLTPANKDVIVIDISMYFQK